MADPWKRREVIGNATLYLGDCLEVVAHLQAERLDDLRVSCAKECSYSHPSHANGCFGVCKRELSDFDESWLVDAVITDPPYGQAYKVNTFYKGGARDNAVLQRNGKTLMVHPNVYPDIHGDDRPFDPVPWRDVAPVVLMWGAHKFADRLPPGGWLIRVQPRAFQKGPLPFGAEEPSSRAVRFSGFLAF